MTVTTHAMKCVVFLLCVLALSACSMAGGAAASVAGNYTCTDSILDSLRLTGDGKAVATATLLGETQTKDGTYQVNGNKVTVTIPAFPAATAEFTLSGATLDAGVNGKCTKQ